MKANRIFLLLMLCATLNTVYAQLPDGTMAPNIVANDINGNPHNLYDYLGQGYTVILNIGATWCGPCLSYHNTSALQDFYNTYGPSGTDEVMVLWIDAWAGTTMADFNGTGGLTVGDWITGTPFPIIDHDPALTDFAMNYFPTIFRVCPSDSTLNEINQLAGLALETAVFTPECGAPSCNADNPVSGLSSTVDGGNVTLSWNPVAGSVGCRVKMRQVGTSDLRSKTLYGSEVSTVIFPTDAVAAGTHKWRVKCSCNPAAGETTPNSPFDFFTVTSLREASQATKVWPNPASDFLQIDMGGEGYQMYRLINAHGKVVMENSFDGTFTQQLDISSLPAGTYYIELVAQQDTKVETILISGK